MSMDKGDVPVLRYLKQVESSNRETAKIRTQFERADKAAKLAAQKLAHAIATNNSPAITRLQAELKIRSATARAAYEAYSSMRETMLTERSKTDGGVRRRAAVIEHDRRRGR